MGKIDISAEMQQHLVIDPLDPAFNYAGRSFIWQIVYE
jgi:hypothetical protein